MRLEHAEVLYQPRPVGSFSRIGRSAWLLVAAVLAMYVVGFLVFPPDTLTVRDEASYIRQARVFASGATSGVIKDPLTDATTSFIPAHYPVGTALLMVPFVKLLGWQGAFFVPLLCLLAAVFVTARWIHEEGRSPLFALFIMLFPAALVMGRVGMSDVPSMLLVSLGLYTFWRGIDGKAVYWLLSGFIAGASLCFREANPLFFVFFFLGALIRRERNVWALIVAGIAGAAIRPLTGVLFFGDAFYYKSLSHTFNLQALAATIPLYLIGLVIFVPGGLIAALAYRGRRRPELIATVVSVVAFYSFYSYSGGESGLVKSLILGLRFFLPLLPILVFAMAEVATRWWTYTEQSPRRRAWQVSAALATSMWLAGLAVAAFGVHWFLHRWGASQAQIRDTIQAHTDVRSVLVSNLLATQKFISELELSWAPLERDQVDAQTIRTLLERHGEFYVVLLDRYESDFWRTDAERNATFAAGLSEQAVVRFDQAITSNEHVRIWRVIRQAR